MIFSFVLFCNCKEQEGRIGGKNSLYFSLIHYEYIYTKVNLTFPIDYNSISKVDIYYDTPPQARAYKLIIPNLLHR